MATEPKASEPKASEPKGVMCECGHYEAFSMWVYAHWRERVNYTCQKCQATYLVVMGVAEPDKKKVKK